VLQTTNMLFELGLPGFDTVIHNSKACSVRENACNNTKNVKSHVFLKSEKNVKKRRPTAYVQFHRPLNHSAFNTQLPKPKLSARTGKSQTSHTLLRNADTRN